ncbi:MAG: 7-cyano-7-deazaguanine synthase QueC [Planctomycetales bacterium]|nr:7-cyano-7-deazaguanine synthase QueC [Planctomycetales bacterium]
MSDENFRRPAVVLLSGGLDSATVLAIAQERGYTINALSFRYGQRHEYELHCARRIASNAGVRQHSIVEIDLAQFGHSALTSDIAVPKHSLTEEVGADIPVTYVPARNTVFLSLALAYAETLDAFDIFIGVNALDYSGYPDCRPEYIEAFERLANLATKACTTGQGRMVIHTPLIQMTKAQIIQLGLKLGVDYAHTSSCYDPNESGLPCGACDACLLRNRGFEQLGLQDPAMFR